MTGFRAVGSVDGRPERLAAFLGRFPGRWDLCQSGRIDTCSAALAGRENEGLDDSRFGRSVLAVLAQVELQPFERGLGSLRYLEARLDVAVRDEATFNRHEVTVTRRAGLALLGALAAVRLAIDVQVVVAVRSSLVAAGDAVRKSGARSAVG